MLKYLILTNEDLQKIDDYGYTDNINELKEIIKINFLEKIQTPKKNNFLFELDIDDDGYFSSLLLKIGKHSINTEENYFDIFDIAYMINSHFSITYEKKVDYTILNNISFNIEMFIGGTGSGKTYKAITENDNFVIAVPTRQLAYEIAIDYKNKIDTVYTGEVHIKGNKNAVVVYEELNETFLKQYDCLIIDEAHYINDEQRGVDLLNNIIKAIKNEKKVIFLTATDTLNNGLKNILNIKTIELQPFKTIQREKIEFDEVPKLAEKNKSILVFTKYRPDEYSVEEYAKYFGVDINKADYISADIPTSERLLKQIAFREGNIQLMVSSNVLAQGVNFPADIVVIEYNEWDEWEIIQQKIGRAGRPQFNKNKAYYALHEIPKKEIKNIPNTKVVNQTIFYRGIFINDWNKKFEEFEIPTDLNEYRNFKYSKRFLTELVDRNIANEEEIKALEFLINEETKVKEILNIKLK